VFLQPAVDDFGLDLQEGDAAEAGADPSAELLDGIAVGRMVDHVVDEQDRFRAVELGVDGLVLNWA